MRIALDPYMLRTTPLAELPGVVAELGYEHIELSPREDFIPFFVHPRADRATIDLKPFATNAQKKIAAVIADFQKNEDGVRVAADITRLRLADIAFDSKTLRVIAEAEGAINVTITTLQGL